MESLSAAEKKQQQIHQWIERRIPTPVATSADVSADASADEESLEEMQLVAPPTRIRLRIRFESVSAAEKKQQQIHQWIERRIPTHKPNQQAAALWSAAAAAAQVDKYSHQWR